MTEPLRHPDPPISLSGCRLRPWAATDVPALVAAWRDPEMHRWMPEETHPFDAVQARAFVDGAATHLTDGRSIALAIADAAADQAVGSVMLHVWGCSTMSVPRATEPRFNSNRDDVIFGDKSGNASGLSAPPAPGATSLLP